MSKLAIEKCGGPLEALTSLFRSERFTHQDMANASAMMSQNGKPHKEQSIEDIINFMLNEWGIGMDNAIATDSDGVLSWVYDSMAFLTKNPCIIGFILKHNNGEWRAVKRLEDTWEWQLNKQSWDRVERHEIINKIMGYKCPTYIIWKQWIPLKKWIKDFRPFYIRSSDTEASSRWEYEPTSCWMPQKMVYTGHDKNIAKILKRWASPCLISNAKQFIALSPGSDGWDQETIMEFDSLPVGTVADRLSGLVQKTIETHISNNPKQKAEIMPFVAHALMTVATKFGIKINHRQLSAFQLDDFDLDRDELRKYDKELSKIK